MQGVVTIPVMNRIWLAMIATTAMAWWALQPRDVDVAPSRLPTCDEPVPAAVLRTCDEPVEVAVRPGAPDPDGALALARRLIDDHLDAATRETGVFVRYIDHEEEIEADRGMLPVEAERLPLALDVLTEALSHYPEEVLVELIDEIHFTDTLYDGHTTWLGKADCRTRVFRVGLYSKRDDRDLARTIHHELAHLWMCRDPAVRDAWVSMYERPREGLSRAELRRAGFVTPYASTNAGEDFAEMWEAWMDRPDRLEVQAASNPRLADKLARLHADGERLSNGDLSGWTPRHPPQ